jgi:subtilisin family serine protease
MRTVVGGMKGSFGAAIFVVAIVASSIGTAWTAAPAFAARVDPLLRAGDLALVHTTAGAAGALSSKLETLGATEVRTYTSVDTVVARLSSDALDAVRAARTVTVATSDTTVVAMGGGRNSGFDSDPKASGGTGAGAAQFVSIDAIRAPLAWTKSTGAGVTVAVMDSGISTHPDLPKSKIVASADFVRDGKTGDPAGHGTHIAGLIAANGNMRGVAPDASVVSLRVLDANGNGTASGIVGAFDWLLKHGDQYGVKVVNLSWGAPQATSYHRDLFSALAEAAWFSGIAVVAAAGNAGPDAGTITTPGSDPFVITAGAFDDAATAKTQDDREAAFSSHGPTLDGFAKPDTLAPGAHVWSLRVPGLVYRDQSGDPIGSTSDLYVRLTGTSASAGLVTGVVALVAAAHPDYTPTQLKGAVVASGRKVTGSRTKAVDAPAALTAMTSVNKGLEPSRLLLDILSKNGIKIQRSGVTWEGVTWENVTWENVTWESVSWEGVTWEGATWQQVGPQ